jgi:hypothetical protein
MKGEKTLKLTSILQGPDEPYQEFVACLLKNIGRTVVDTKAGNILLTRSVRQPLGHRVKEILCRK